MKRKIVLLISLILTAIMSFAFTACVTNGDTDNSASTSYLYSFTLLDDNGDVVVGEATFSAEGREDVSALIINGVTKKVSLFFDTTYTITVEGYEPGTVTIDADGYESAKQITLVKIVPRVTLNVTATDQTGAVLDAIVTPSAPNNNYVIGETYTVTVDGYDGQQFTFVAGPSANVDFVFVRYATLNVSAIDTKGDSVDDIVITDGEGNEIADGVYVYGETYYVTSESYGQTEEFVAGDVDVEVEFIKYVTLNVTAFNQLDEELDVIITDSEGVEVTDGVFVYGDTYTVTVDGYDGEKEFVAGEENIEFFGETAFIKYVIATINVTNQDDVPLTPIVRDAGGYDVEPVEGNANQFKLVAGDTYFVGVTGVDDEYEFSLTEDGTVEHVFTLVITTVELNVVAKDQTGAILTAIVTPAVENNIYTIGETYTVTVDGYQGQSFEFVAAPGVDVEFDGFITYVTLSVVAKDQTDATLTAVVTPSVTDNKYVVGTTYTVTVDGYENQSFTFTASEGVDVVFDDFVKYATLNVVAKDQTAASVTDIVITDGNGDEITNGVYVYGETYYVTSVSYDGQTKEFVAGDIDVVIEFTLYVTVTITAVDQNNNEVVATIEGVDGYKVVVGNDYTVVAEGCKGSFEFTASKDVTTYNYNFFTNDTDEYSITLIDNLGAKLTGEVTFTADGAYNPSVTLEDGVATVVLEYNKTYVVSLNSNYFTANVIVDASGDIDTTTVTLYKKIIDVSSHPELTYVNDTISYNGLSDTKDIALIDKDRVYAEMIISHSLPAGSTETFGVGIKLAATSENHTYGTRFVEAGHNDNKTTKTVWQLRKMNGGWTYYSIPGSEDKLAVTYKLVVAIKGTTVYAYILDVETGATLTSMIYTDSNYKAFNMISFYDKTSNTVVSDIKLYNYIPENAIEYIAGSNTSTEDYVVNVDPGVATYGQDNTIEIAPVEGKAITNVVVKNASYTTDVNDGVWTIVLQPSAYGQKVSVTVTAEDIVTASVTLPPENEFYTVTANSTIATGYKLNITVTPKVETVVITAIYVDGVKVVDGASAAFIKLNNATNHVITVTYDNDTSKVTLTLKTDGKTSPIEDGEYIPQGQAVVFTSGADTINATAGANGLVEVILPFGDWTISTGNYRSQTITTSASEPSIVLTKTLVYEMFTDSTQTDSYIANGYKFSTKTKQYFKDSDVLYAEMTIKSPTDSVIAALTSQTSGQVVAARTAEYPDNNSSYGIVGGDANVTSVAKGDLKLRWASSKPSKWTTTTEKAQFISDFVSAYDAGTLKIGLLIKGGLAWALVGVGNDMYIDDCWNGGTFTNLTYIGTDFVAEYSNIRFARTLDALPGLGYGLFTAEHQGFNSANGWTVEENADGSYNIESSTSASSVDLTAKQTFDSKYYSNNNPNGIFFTKDSQVSFDLEMNGSTSESGVGWMVHFRFKGGTYNAQTLFCSWSTNVNVKNGGTAGMSAANLLANGATKVDNGDGTFTWKFSGVFKADENGYLALYNKAGKFIFTTANVGSACKMEGFNNFYISVENAKSTGSFKITNLKIDI